MGATVFSNIFISNIFHDWGKLSLTNYEEVRELDGSFGFLGSSWLPSKGNCHKGAKTHA